ncbi:hypothetical protein BUALT_Bualt01G0107500 [Buddleja alternifolia]|uniref:Ureidoglycolate hydrolase n=1 Tax=Buddleja alternifolia TaxID=168488 RepID=A0AAV6YGJ9_9LAMI|nr:hypothetical protein BUALT_Bualt01G0107500 [Buddleja alternifolia]
MATTISDDNTASYSPHVIKLKPIEATPETFKEFGQVIEVSPDGDEFGPHDAQLHLSNGVPRFYIMHIEDRPLKFSTITHHASVTQCLGSIGGHVWYLGVAKPSIVDPNEIKGTIGVDPVQSHCGHFYVPPAVDDIRVFRISGPKFLKLNRGTWHAGPLFLGKAMDFYNLELSNTNDLSDEKYGHLAIIKADKLRDDEKYGHLAIIKARKLREAGGPHSTQISQVLFSSH